MHSINQYNQSAYELAHATNNNNNSSSSPNFHPLDAVSLTKKCLLTTGFSEHIIQNYSILAQEIAAPLEIIKPQLHLQPQQQHSVLSSSNGESNSSSSCEVSVTSTTNASSASSSSSGSGGGGGNKRTWSSTKARRIRDMTEDHGTLASPK
jgi:hypothetical protein